MEPVKVQVTRNMVDYALQQTSTLCAVALALRDANEDGDWILPHVDQDTIRVTDRRTQQRYIWKTPKKVANYIDKFDRQREAVGPMAFVLGEPDEIRSMTRRQPSEMIQQAIAREKRKQRPSESPEAKKARGDRRVPVNFTNTRLRTLREPLPEE